MSFRVKTVLLLGGTGEARALAGKFARANVRLIASLAGVTEAPNAYSCEMRRGGFGGCEGLRSYLRDESVSALVDATHPFATRMSRHAQKACAAQSIPRVALVRPPWSAMGDWRPFETLTDAVAALPSAARVLATTGRKDIAPYLARPDIRIFLRSVDPVENLPANIVAFEARGPFTVEAEISVMRSYGITHLLTRNAGGESRARLDAAAALGLPLHIVERPLPPVGPVVHSVADALRWLEAVLGD